MDFLHFVVDWGQASILISIDFLTAFDIIDYNILLPKLPIFIGLSNTTFSLLPFYLSDLSPIYIGGSTSNPASVHHGIPQGAVVDHLGPAFGILACYLNVLVFLSVFMQTTHKFILLLSLFFSGWVFYSSLKPSTKKLRYSR